MSTDGAFEYWGYLPTVLMMLSHCTHGIPPLSQHPPALMIFPSSYYKEDSFVRYCI